MTQRVFDVENEKDIADYWNSYEKNECKHYEIDLDKLAEVYVIDKELKQDD